MDGRSPANVTAVQRREGHGIPERIINSFHVEPVDSNNPLLQNRAHCEICSEGYQRGNWVRKLPCKHKVIESYLSDDLKYTYCMQSPNYYSYPALEETMWTWCE